MGYGSTKGKHSASDVVVALSLHVTVLKCKVKSYDVKNKYHLRAGGRIQRVRGHSKQPVIRPYSG
jgi:hypothetical protein